MRGTEFCDGTDVIRKQIALSRYAARGGAVCWVGDRKVVGVASVALKLSLDSDVLAEVKSARTAATIQGERRDDVIVLRIGVNVGIIACDFNLVVVVLRKYHRSHQSNPENYCASDFHPISPSRCSRLGKDAATKGGCSDERWL